MPDQDPIFLAIQGRLDAISGFLASQTARIDAVIAAQADLRTDLALLRQEVTNHFATRAQTVDRLWRTVAVLASGLSGFVTYLVSHLVHRGTLP